ncbi:MULTISPECIES: hypothetical protein [Streptomycetaceae]|uniref:Uncharacterized protein n=1 Tax=Streptantibioticus cattleyicolor (strain ATCC 35852 / DSM 46488 / JCM 4925 / NBRC 14057 / NRRL 8057) TaxID=1003195 RepID=F8JY85_STREN|nr:MULTISPECIES: hypothetical protein [Streptomycetaceae]AEW94671.1 hypothetical protein SCATT_23000 [Streptantibioticus cattleyicolor NRRL 8057 = DSM 46488]MYS59306.1 hypothetical protein [Streptomyces sp. SID5468]CCB75027.1 protein of unknown function [Streptantibioticus cattleyicolor NRRL 8057 = DSM 46488]
MPYESHFDVSGIYELGNAWIDLSDTLWEQLTAMDGAVHGIAWTGDANAAVQATWNLLHDKQFQPAVDAARDIGNKINAYGDYIASLQQKEAAKAAAMDLAMLLGDIFGLGLMMIPGLGEGLAELIGAAISSVVKSLGELVSVGLEAVAQFAGTIGGEVLSQVGLQLGFDIAAQGIADAVYHVPFELDKDFWKGEALNLGLAGGMPIAMSGLHLVGEGTSMAKNWLGDKNFGSGVKTDAPAPMTGTGTGRTPTPAPEITPPGPAAFEHPPVGSVGTPGNVDATRPVLSEPAPGTLPGKTGPGGVPETVTPGPAKVDTPPPATGVTATNRPPAAPVTRQPKPDPALNTRTGDTNPPVETPATTHPSRTADSTEPGPGATHQAGRTSAQDKATTAGQRGSLDTTTTEHTGPPADPAKQTVTARPTPSEGDKTTADPTPSEADKSTLKPVTSDTDKTPLNAPDKAPDKTPPNPADKTPDKTPAKPLGKPLDKTADKTADKTVDKTADTPTTEDPGKTEHTGTTQESTRNTTRTTATDDTALTHSDAGAHDSVSDKQHGVGESGHTSRDTHAQPVPHDDATAVHEPRHPAPPHDTTPAPHDPATRHALDKGKAELTEHYGAKARSERDFHRSMADLRRRFDDMAGRSKRMAALDREAREEVWEQVAKDARTAYEDAHAGQAGKGADGVRRADAVFQRELRRIGRTFPGRAEYHANAPKDIDARVARIQRRLRSDGFSDERIDKLTPDLRKEITEHYEATYGRLKEKPFWRTTSSDRWTFDQDAERLHQSLADHARLRTLHDDLAGDIDTWAEEWTRERPEFGARDTAPTADRYKRSAWEALTRAVQETTGRGRRGATAMTERSWRELTESFTGRRDELRARMHDELDAHARLRGVLADEPRLGGTGPGRSALASMRDDARELLHGRLGDPFDTSRTDRFRGFGKDLDAVKRTAGRRLAFETRAERHTSAVLPKDAGVPGGRSRNDAGALVDAHLIKAVGEALTDARGWLREHGYTPENVETALKDLDTRLTAVKQDIPKLTAAAQHLPTALDEAEQTARHLYGTDSGVPHPVQDDLRHALRQDWLGHYDTVLTGGRLDAAHWSPADRGHPGPQHGGTLRNGQRQLLDHYDHVLSIAERRNWDLENLSDRYRDAYAKWEADAAAAHTSSARAQLLGERAGQGPKLSPEEREAGLAELEKELRDDFHDLVHGREPGTLRPDDYRDLYDRWRRRTDERLSNLAGHFDHLHARAEAVSRARERALDFYDRLPHPDGPHATLKHRFAETYAAVVAKDDPAHWASGTMDEGRLHETLSFVTAHQHLEKDILPRAEQALRDAARTKGYDEHVVTAARDKLRQDVHDLVGEYAARLRDSGQHPHGAGDLIASGLTTRADAMFSRHALDTRLLVQRHLADDIRDLRHTVDRHAWDLAGLDDAEEHFIGERTAKLVKSADEHLGDVLSGIRPLLGGELDPGFRAWRQDADTLLRDAPRDARRQETLYEAAMTAGRVFDTRYATLAGFDIDTLHGRSSDGGDFTAEIEAFRRDHITLAARHEGIGAADLDHWLDHGTAGRGAFTEGVERGRRHAEQTRPRPAGTVPVPVPEKHPVTVEDVPEHHPVAGGTLPHDGPPLTEAHEPATTTHQAAVTVESHTPPPSREVKQGQEWSHAKHQALDAAAAHLDDQLRVDRRRPDLSADFGTVLDDAGLTTHLTPSQVDTLWNDFRTEATGRFDTVYRPGHLGRPRTAADWARLDDEWRTGYRDLLRNLPRRAARAVTLHNAWHAVALAAAPKADHWRGAGMTAQELKTVHDLLHERIEQLVTAEDHTSSGLRRGLARITGSLDAVFQHVADARRARAAADEHFTALISGHAGPDEESWAAPLRQTFLTKAEEAYHHTWRTTVRLGSRPEDTARTVRARWQRELTALTDDLRGRIAGHRRTDRDLAAVEQAAQAAVAHWQRTHTGTAQLTGDQITHLYRRLADDLQAGAGADLLVPQLPGRIAAEAQLADAKAELLETALTVLAQHPAHPTGPLTPAARLRAGLTSVEPITTALRDALAPLHAKGYPADEVTSAVTAAKQRVVQVLTKLPDRFAEEPAREQAWQEAQRAFARLLAERPRLPKTDVERIRQDFTARWMRGYETSHGLETAYSAQWDLAHDEAAPTTVPAVEAPGPPVHDDDHEQTWEPAAYDHQTPPVSLTAIRNDIAAAPPATLGVIYQALLKVEERIEGGRHARATFLRDAVRDAVAVYRAASDAAPGVVGTVVEIAGQQVVVNHGFNNYLLPFDPQRTPRSATDPDQVTGIDEEYATGFDYPANALTMAQFGYLAKEFYRGALPTATDAQQHARNVIFLASVVAESSRSPHTLTAALLVLSGALDDTPVTSVFDLMPMTAGGTDPGTTANQRSPIPGAGDVTATTAIRQLTVALAALRTLHPGRDHLRAVTERLAQGTPESALIDAVATDLYKVLTRSLGKGPGGDWYHDRDYQQQATAPEPPVGGKPLFTSDDLPPVHDDLLDPARWADVRDLAPVSRLAVERFEPRDDRHTTGLVAQPGKLPGWITEIRYDVRMMEPVPGHWVAEYTVRIDLRAGNGVTDEQLASYVTQVRSDVDTHVNGRFRLPDSGAQFHLTVEFTADDPHHVVTLDLQPRSAAGRRLPRMNQRRWFYRYQHDAGPVLHELFHSLGLGEEYYEAASVFRSGTRHRPGKDDGGFMGAWPGADGMRGRYLKTIEDITRDHLRTSSFDHQAIERARARQPRPAPAYRPPVRVPADGRCLLYAALVGVEPQAWPEALRDHPALAGWPREHGRAALMLDPARRPELDAAATALRDQVLAHLDRVGPAGLPDEVVRPYRLRPANLDHLGEDVTAPLTPAEFAALRDAVSRWAWNSDEGETFPGLVAHAMGVRFRIVVSPPDREPFTHVIGPHHGPLAELHYNGTDHYDATVPERTTGTPPPHPSAVRLGEVATVTGLDGVRDAVLTYVPASQHELFEAQFGEAGVKEIFADLTGGGWTRTVGEGNAAVEIGVVLELDDPVVGTEAVEEVKVSVKPGDGVGSALEVADKAAERLDVPIQPLAFLPGLGTWSPLRTLPVSLTLKGMFSKAARESAAGRKTQTKATGELTGTGRVLTQQATWHVTARWASGTTASRTVEQRSTVTRKFPDALLTPTPVTSEPVEGTFALPASHVPVHVAAGGLLDSILGELPETFGVVGSGVYEKIREFADRANLQASSHQLFDTGLVLPLKRGRDEAAVVLVARAHDAQLITSLDEATLEQGTKSKRELRNAAGIGHNAEAAASLGFGFLAGKVPGASGYGDTRSVNAKGTATGVVQDTHGTTVTDAVTRERGTRYQGPADLRSAHVTYTVTVVRRGRAPKHATVTVENGLLVLVPSEGTVKSASKPATLDQGLAALGQTEYAGGAKELIGRIAGLVPEYVLHPEGTSAGAFRESLARDFPLRAANLAGLYSVLSPAGMRELGDTGRLTFTLAKTTARSKQSHPDLLTVEIVRTFAGDLVYEGESAHHDLTAGDTSAVKVETKKVLKTSFDVDAELSAAVGQGTGQALRSVNPKAGTKASGRARERSTALSTGADHGYTWTGSGGTSTYRATVHYRLTIRVDDGVPLTGRVLGQHAVLRLPSALVPTATTPHTSLKPQVTGSRSLAPGHTALLPAARPGVVTVTELPKVYGVFHVSPVLDVLATEGAAILTATSTDPATKGKLKSLLTPAHDTRRGLEAQQLVDAFGSSAFGANLGRVLSGGYRLSLSRYGWLADELGDLTLGGALSNPRVIGEAEFTLKKSTAAANSGKAGDTATQAWEVVAGLGFGTRLDQLNLTPAWSGKPLTGKSASAVTEETSVTAKPALTYTGPVALVAFDASFVLAGVSTSHAMVLDVLGAGDGGTAAKEITTSNTVVLVVPRDEAVRLGYLTPRAGNATAPVQRATDRTPPPYLPLGLGPLTVSHVDAPAIVGHVHGLIQQLPSERLWPFSGQRIRNKLLQQLSAFSTPEALGGLLGRVVGPGLSLFDEADNAFGRGQVQVLIHGELVNPRRVAPTARSGADEETATWSAERETAAKHTTENTLETTKGREHSLALTVGEPTLVPPVTEGVDAKWTRKDAVTTTSTHATETTASTTAADGTEEYDYDLRLGVSVLVHSGPGRLPVYLTLGALRLLDATTTSGGQATVLPRAVRLSAPDEKLLADVSHTYRDTRETAPVWRELPDGITELMLPVTGDVRDTVLRLVPEARHDLALFAEIVQRLDPRLLAAGVLKTPGQGYAFPLTGFRAALPGPLGRIRVRPRIAEPRLLGTTTAEGTLTPKRTHGTKTKLSDTDAFDVGVFKNDLTVRMGGVPGADGGQAGSVHNWNPPFALPTGSWEFPWSAERSIEAETKGDKAKQSGDAHLVLVRVDYEITREWPSGRTRTLHAPRQTGVLRLDDTAATTLHLPVTPVTGSAFEEIDEATATALLDAVTTEPTASTVPVLHVAEASQDDPWQPAAAPEQASLSVNHLLAEVNAASTGVKEVLYKALLEVERRITTTTGNGSRLAHLRDTILRGVDAYRQAAADGTAAGAVGTVLDLYGQQVVVNHGHNNYLVPFDETLTPRSATDPGRVTAIDAQHAQAFDYPANPLTLGQFANLARQLHAGQLPVGSGRQSRMNVIFLASVVAETARCPQTLTAALLVLTGLLADLPVGSAFDLMPMTTGSTDPGSTSNRRSEIPGAGDVTVTTALRQLTVALAALRIRYPQRDFLQAIDRKLGEGSTAEQLVPGVATALYQALSETMDDSWYTDESALAGHLGEYDDEFHQAASAPPATTTAPPPATDDVTDLPEVHHDLLAPSDWDTHRELTNPAQLATASYEIRGNHVWVPGRAPDGTNLLGPAPRQLPAWVTDIRYDLRLMEPAPGRRVAEFTVRLDLRPGAGVTDTRVTRLKRRLLALLDTSVNGRYKLPGGEQFHLRVEFTAGNPHHVVEVVRRDPRGRRESDQKRWYHKATDGTLLHELFHSLGLREEYRTPESVLRSDQPRPVPPEARPATRQLTDDGGFMGRLPTADGMRQRYLDRIDAVMRENLVLHPPEHRAAFTETVHDHPEGTTARTAQVAATLPPVGTGTLGHLVAALSQLPAADRHALAADHALMADWRARLGNGFGKAAAELLLDVADTVARPLLAKQEAGVRLTALLRDPDVALRLLRAGARVTVVPFAVTTSPSDPRRPLIAEDAVLRQDSASPGDGRPLSVALLHDVAGLVYDLGLTPAQRHAFRTVAQEAGLDLTTNTPREHFARLAVVQLGHAFAPVPSGDLDAMLTGWFGPRRGHQVDKNDALDAIAAFLGAHDADFTAARPELARYERADLKDFDTAAQVRTHNQRKALLLATLKSSSATVPGSGGTLWRDAIPDDWRDQADTVYAALLTGHRAGPVHTDPHIEKAARNVAATKKKVAELAQLRQNRNHIIADTMLHKYVTAAVFTARTLDDAARRRAVEVFTEFTEALGFDADRKAKNLKAVGRLATALIRADLEQLQAGQPDYAALYGATGLHAALTAAESVTDADQARSALTGITGHLPPRLAALVRDELDTVRQRVHALTDDPATLPTVHDAFHALHHAVRTHALNDLALVAGLTAERQLHDVQALLESAADARSTTSRTARLAIAAGLGRVRAEFTRLGHDPGRQLTELLDDLMTRLGTTGAGPALHEEIPAARLRQLAAELGRHRRPVYDTELRQALARFPAVTTTVAKRAARELRSVGDQVGGARVTGDPRTGHPVTLYERALTDSSLTEVTAKIADITSMLSNSRHNLRNGDADVNQTIQNFLDPPVLRHHDLLTGVAHGQLGEQALYTPHANHVLDSLTLLEDAGLVPVALRHLMRPSTYGEVKTGSTRAESVTKQLGTDQPHTLGLPLSSSGDFTTRAGQDPLTEEQVTALVPSLSAPRPTPMEDVAGTAPDSESEDDDPAENEMTSLADAIGTTLTVSRKRQASPDAADTLTDPAKKTRLTLPPAFLDSEPARRPAQAPATTPPVPLTPGSRLLSGRLTAVEWAPGDPRAGRGLGHARYRAGTLALDPAAPAHPLATLLAGTGDGEPPTVVHLTDLLPGDDDRARETVESLLRRAVTIAGDQRAGTVVVTTALPDVTDILTGLGLTPVPGAPRLLHAPTDTLAQALRDRPEAHDVAVRNCET